MLTFAAPWTSVNDRDRAGSICFSSNFHLLLSGVTGNSGLKPLSLDASCVSLGLLWQTPQPGWLKITEMYYLTDLEAGSPGSKCPQDWFPLRPWGRLRPGLSLVPAGLWGIFGDPQRADVSPWSLLSRGVLPVSLHITVPLCVSVSMSEFPLFVRTSAIFD